MLIKHPMTNLAAIPSEYPGHYKDCKTKDLLMMYWKYSSYPEQVMLGTDVNKSNFRNI